MCSQIVVDELQTCLKVYSLAHELVSILLASSLTFFLIIPAAALIQPDSTFSETADTLRLPSNLA